MMRVRVSSTRRRRHTVSSAPQKVKVGDIEKKEDVKKQHKKSVQWASELADQIPKAPLRKCKSDSFIEFDQALKKLTKVSSLLERSETLEKDYEENLQSIQEKLKTGIDLKSADE